MLKTMSSFITSHTNTSKTHNFQCPKHPRMSINQFCLKNNCESPYLCSLCKLNHPWQHVGYFQTVESVYKDQVIADYATNLNSDYSLDSVGIIFEKTMKVLLQIETDILEFLRELKARVKQSFADLVENIGRRREVYTKFMRYRENPPKTPLPLEEYIKNLLRSYKLLKSDNSTVFDLRIMNISDQFRIEANETLQDFKKRLSSSLNPKIDFEHPDFTRLHVKHTFKVPYSSGVLYQACTYIKKWNILAVGFKQASWSCLGLYDMETHNLAAINNKAHKAWTNHVIWIEQKSFILTCSNDNTIRVYKLSDNGRRLNSLGLLRGHTGHVRCIKYLDDVSLLVSAGFDVNIKVWSLNNLKKCGEISTNSKNRIEGTFAYIKTDKLIGAAFYEGFIRFYHLFSKELVFQLKTGYQHDDIYGLQYIPAKKVILASVTNNKVQIWNYSEESRTAELAKAINLDGYYPNCILISQNQENILCSAGSRYVEAYNFISEKTTRINLSEIKKASCLAFLEFGKVLVSDMESGNFCILS